MGMTNVPKESKLGRRQRRDMRLTWNQKNGEVRANFKTVNNRNVTFQVTAETIREFTVGVDNDGMCRLSFEPSDIPIQYNVKLKNPDAVLGTDKDDQRIAFLY